MLKGNFSCIKSAIALQPTNKIKVLFGVRTADDGREYQDIYTNTVLRNNSNSVAKLQSEIEEAKNNGGLSNRTYEFCDLKEYVVEATNFNEAPAAPDPFTPNENPTGPTPW